ncbi:MAG: type 1 glutamine amidotransferase domain-containing protein [Chitinivorax sp.]
MNVIVPIPSHDFDPTEVAVSWKVLCDAGHQVYFATPDGAPGRADPLMLSGEGLDVCKRLANPSPQFPLDG